MENRVEGSTRLAWSPVVRCSRCTLPVRLALNISSLLSDTRACFYYPSWPLSKQSLQTSFLYIYLFFPGGLMYMHGKESKKPEIQYSATDSCGTQSITIREHAFDYLLLDAGRSLFLLFPSKSKLVSCRTSRKIGRRDIVGTLSSLCICISWRICFVGRCLATDG